MISLGCVCCNNSKDPMEIKRNHESSDSWVPPKYSSGDTVLSFKGYRGSGGSGSNSSITLMLLLDTTGDMFSDGSVQTDYLAYLRNNINNIVTALEGAGFTDIKIGYISYGDTVDAPYEPTDQYNDLISSLETVNHHNGYDYVEAGLEAVKQGAIYLKGSSYSAYKVMLLITNTFSHDDLSANSNGSTICFNNRRCCSVQSVVNELQNISEPERNRLKFFYLAPSTSTDGRECQNETSFLSPKAQLDKLLENGLGNNNGAYLGWANNGDFGTMISTNMVNKLKSMPKPTGSGSSSSDVVCLIKEAQFEMLGTKMSFKSTYEAQYQFYKHGVDSSALVGNKDVIEAVKSGNFSGGTASVNQSCFYVSDAEKGEFSEPLSTSTVSIPYKVIRVD